MGNSNSRTATTNPITFSNNSASELSKDEHKLLLRSIMDVFQRSLQMNELVDDLFDKHNECIKLLGSESIMTRQQTKDALEESAERFSQGRATNRTPTEAQNMMIRIDSLFIEYMGYDEEIKSLSDAIGLIANDTLNETSNNAIEGQQSVSKITSSSSGSTGTKYQHLASLIAELNRNYDELDAACRNLFMKYEKIDAKPNDESEVSSSYQPSKA